MGPTEPANIKAMATAVRKGDRRALARAITLVESTRPDHQAAAADLLEVLLPHTGGAIRLGISGIPGAGKSTFIEAFGGHAITQGRRIAVLAVDPSSQLSGGSILGDKTRMEELAQAPEAFIRPSPASGALGGVARHTHEALLLCEAAGYDLLVIETVGVGQSETAVADLVDMFLLLLVPAAGDELQGLKKGIIELADLVIVNKCDGALTAAATATASQYAAALNLLRPPTPLWRPKVVTCSALTGTGIAAVWDTVIAHRETMTGSGELARRRAEQAGHWLWAGVSEGLLQAFRRHPAVTQRLAEMEAKVRANQITPAAAVRHLLSAFAAAVGGAPDA